MERINEYIGRLKTVYIPSLERKGKDYEFTEIFPIIRYLEMNLNILVN